MIDTGGMTILVVDDDARIRTMLRRYLEREGFAIVEADGASSARARLAEGGLDLVLLDIALGRESGLDLFQEMRAGSGPPTIFVSGKSDTIDRVVGLELGAEDYITKPFELREVLARIRTVLRRNAHHPTPIRSDPALNRGDAVTFDGWRFDRSSRDLQNPAGSPVTLTTSEFDLLSVFVDHPNQSLSRDRLMDLLKGADWTPMDRSIDTQVRRLRRKIEDDGGEPKRIKTIRGVGYLFAPKVAAC